MIDEHNISIAAVDHLEELVKECAKHSEVAGNISIKRTKCTAIINNVTDKYCLELLIDKLQNNCFSIIVDESTDRSGCKHLAIVARFADGNSCDFKIVDQFVDLLPVSDATANNLYNTVIIFLIITILIIKKNL